jgi:hypothetical protein
VGSQQATAAAGMVRSYHVQTFFQLSSPPHPQYPFAHSYYPRPPPRGRVVIGSQQATAAAGMVCTSPTMTVPRPRPRFSFPPRACNPPPKCPMPQNAPTTNSSSLPASSLARHRCRRNGACHK